MSKQQTIDSLMNCAIEAFGDWGFEGASLRQIAAQAGVPLSTINMYFGSKRELYVAAETAVWNEITDERNALLALARASHPDQPLSLQELFASLGRPIVRRTMDRTKPGHARVHFVRSRLNDHRMVDNGTFLSAIDRQVAPWIEAMSQSCPSLSRPDVVWAFSYAIGVIYSWQLIDHRYDGLLGQDSMRTVDSLLDDIVAFCCAGVASMIERRGGMALGL